MALHISRIGTVYSLQQLVEEDAPGIDAAFCTKQALEATTKAAAPSAAAVVPRDAPVDAINGGLIARYSYPCRGSAEQPKLRRASLADNCAVVPDGTDGARGSDSDSDNSSGALVAAPGGPSLLDSVLLATWEGAAEAGLFRYDVTACPSKVLPGRWGFISQLNEGRATKKRPTEFRVDQVVQPFDPSKFHFGKAAVGEVLFAFEPGSQRSPTFEEAAPAGASPNLVLINVSPIEYGHVLLVPRALERLPQLADAAGIALALRFAAELGNPNVRVGFNSLGAYATINHCHYQAYYLATHLPCERAHTAPLRSLLGPAGRNRAVKGTKRCKLPISRLVDYPVNGFVIEAGDAGADEVAAVVGAACARMQAANVPHNLLIADCGARVFLWPQAFAEKQARGEVPEGLADTGVNPAVFEISGHMLLKRAEDYEGVDEAVALALLRLASLTEERFAEVAHMCFGDQA